MKPLWGHGTQTFGTSSAQLSLRLAQFPFNLFLWKKIRMDTKIPSWSLTPEGEGLREAERSLTHPHFTDEESEAFIRRGPAIVIIIKQEGSSLGKPENKRKGTRSRDTVPSPKGCTVRE